MGPRKGSNLSKAHVCLFTDSLDPSGVGEHMLILAQELQRQYRVSFVCPPTPRGLPFLERARELGVSTLSLTAQYNSPALEDLHRWVQQQDIDIFHCHAGITWEGFGGVEVARAAGVPVVVRTEHLPYLLTHPVQRRDHKRTAGLVDRIICVSESSCFSFVGSGIAAHRLKVVRNGVPLVEAEPQRTRLRHELGLAADDRILLSVGRLIEQKGHHSLIDAIPRVVEHHPDAYFVWIGEGPLRNDLIVRLREANLESRVQIVGRRNDIPYILASSDLFVLPSLFEGLPLSVLEAMNAGLPVIGTSVAGTSDAVADGVTGRLVRPGDPDALADAIIETLDNPALAASWGAAGRVRAAREFNAARMVREIDEIYRELLAVHRGGLQALELKQFEVAP